MIGFRTGVIVLCVLGFAGEGPAEWMNWFSVGSGLASLFVMWAMLEALGKISLSVAEERNLAAGLRLGCFLLAESLVIGRAITGDCHSISDTLQDLFDQASLAALAILVQASVLERWARPTRARPEPAWLVFGAIPGLFSLLLAGLALYKLGPWEGMPR